MRSCLGPRLNPRRLTVKMIDPLGRIASEQRDVPHWALEQPPQLGPITVTAVLPRFGFGEATFQAGWQILSPLFEGGLGQYTLSLRLTKETPLGDGFTSIAVEE